MFPRINLGGYDNQPSHYLGKALEKARKSLEGDNSKWDMHSFRRTAVSALVNAGVAKEVRNLAVGHSNKDDLGISVYAKRAELDSVILTTFKALYEELGGVSCLPQFDLKHTEITYRRNQTSRGGKQDDNEKLRYAVGGASTTWTSGGFRGVCDT